MGTCATGTVENGGLDRNMLTDFKTCYGRTEREDDAGEFMADGYRYLFLGYGVWGYWGEGWATEVFV